MFTNKNKSIRIELNSENTKDFLIRNCNCLSGSTLFLRVLAQIGDFSLLKKGQFINSKLSRKKILFNGSEVFV